MFVFCIFLLDLSKFFKCKILFFLDVYYCVTDNLTWASESGNKQYQNEKFKFKWTETEIVYSGGFMDGERERIRANFSAQEKFRSETVFYDGIPHASSRYAVGKFVRIAFLPEEDGGAIVSLKFSSTASLLSTAGSKFI